MAAPIDLENDVRNLVAEILEIEPQTIDSNASFVKELGMDSMMALEVLATLEKKYKIIIPEEALAKFTSLNETVKTIEHIISKKK